MTDEQLEEYANQNVRLVAGGQTMTGKLITGYAAQIRVKAPYAIEWHDVNPTLGTNEERLAAIPHADAVESIELVDESASTEIEEAAAETQTPG
ncbi:MAG: hypothetical protein WB609_10195 [Candidatus Cybelea sp.]